MFQQSHIWLVEMGVCREDLHRVGSKDIMIIVDHGSGRKESSLMLYEFVVRLGSCLITLKTT